MGEAEDCDETYIEGNFGSVLIIETPCLLSQENVVLLVDDKEIVASSAALSMASDVFKSMIESDFRDHKTRQIAMHGKSYEAVKFMLDYITSQDYVPIPGKI